MENQIKQLRTLAHDERIRIIKAINDNPGATVGQLAGILKMNGSMLSQQLARLREAGLVKGKRKSREIFYSVKKNTVNELFQYYIKELSDESEESHKRID